MLNVLSVLIDQSRAKLDKCSAQLGHYLCANKVLDGLLLRGLGIYARIKLLEKRLASVTRGILAILQPGEGTARPNKGIHILRTHLPRCHGRPRGF